MGILRALAVVLSIATATIGAAKDLPQGGFVLTGWVLPGVQQGEIVPIFVHLEIADDRFDWTFVTSYSPNALMCNQSQKCKWAVQGLSHQVDWNEDGGFTIRAAQRHTGDGLTIDRADVDGPHILDKIDALVRDGTLVSTAQGLRFQREARRSKPLVAPLVPASLDDLIDAMSYVQMFELAMSDLDQCGTYPVLRLLAKKNRTVREQEVVDASRYVGFVARLEAENAFYALSEPPADQAQRLEQLRSRFHAYSIALRWPNAFAGRALVGGEPLSDAAVIELAAEGFDKVRSPLGTQADAVHADIFGDKRAGLLAAVRIGARFSKILAEGYDPYQAMCADVTFSQ